MYPRPYMNDNRTLSFLYRASSIDLQMKVPTDATDFIFISFVFLQGHLHGRANSQQHCKNQMVA
jgi:hypothetical protein